MNWTWPKVNFKWSLTGLNLEISFSKTSHHTMVKESSLLDYLYLNRLLVLLFPKIIRAMWNANYLVQDINLGWMFISKYGSHYITTQPLPLPLSLSRYIYIYVCVCVCECVWLCFTFHFVQKRGLSMILNCIRVWCSSSEVLGLWNNFFIDITPRSTQTQNGSIC